MATTPRPGACQHARLRGHVFDSVAVMPLAGARVEVVSAADRSRILFSTVSDSLGVFTVEGVARGEYIAGFLHPMLDSLGLAFAQRLIDVNSDGDVDLDLAVPSPARIEGALCPPPADRTANGVILGYVLNSHTLAPAESATVIGQWAEIGFGDGSFDRTVATRRATSDGLGWFSLCGLPTGTTITLRAAVDADTSGPIEIEVPNSRIARRTVYVDHQVLVGTGTPTPAAVDTAPVTLTGWIRTEDGVPVRGARVTIFGRETFATTNADGAFQLTGIPGGTQTLVTRAIGFVPDERAVDLTDRRVPVIIGLTSLRRFLDTVHVRAKRVSLTTAVGFDDRRRLGAGRFFTPEDIARLHPHELTDIFHHVSSLEMHTDNAHNVTIRMRGDRAPCTPAIFVDGKQFANWELNDLNGIVQPDQIAGLEIYTASMTPTEFLTQMGCGTVIVWTRSAASPDHD